MRHGKRRQVGDHDPMLAGGGSEREQALLRALQFARVEIGRGQCPGEPLLGLLERGERLVEGGDRIVEQPARLGHLALQPAHQAGQNRHRRGAAGHRLMRLGDIAGDLLGAHHLLAPVGERVFLAFLRRQRRELVDRGAQILGLDAGRSDPGAEIGQRRFRLPPGGMGHGDRLALPIEPAEGIEQRPVHGRLDQGAIGMLTVDLDQRRADLAQQHDRHRRIVDEGAAAPVGALHAAQDQVALGFDAAVGKDRPRRMIGGHVEDRGDIALGAVVAHQRGVAAPAQRQRQGIEQDGLAGAGLAGKRRQPGGEVRAEAVDDDDIAYGKGDEHGRSGGKQRNRISWYSCRQTPC